MALDDNQPPKITTEFGTVPEWARRQAVINMRRDPAKLAEMIAKFGEERIRRDYPEVFLKDDDETQA